MFLADLKYPGNRRNHALERLHPDEPTHRPRKARFDLSFGKGRWLMKAKKCGYCGSINLPDTRRCPRCGTNIASAIVSDDYEREDMLTSGDHVIPISSINDTDLVKALRRASTPRSGNSANPEPETRAPKLAANAETSTDEAEAEMSAAEKPRPETSSASSESSGPLPAAPARVSTRLVGGSRLLGWLLLVGALLTAVYTVKKFGFSGDPQSSFAGLLGLEHWDPYWVVLAAGIAALGLIGFVMLHLGAAIVENLVVIRAELQGASLPVREIDETPAKAGDPREALPAPQQGSTVKGSDKPEKTATPMAARAHAGSGGKPEIAVPEFSLSPDQFLEPEQEDHGTLELELVDDVEGDRRKEPTLGA